MKTFDEAIQSVLFPSADDPDAVSKLEAKVRAFDEDANFHPIVRAILEKSVQDSFVDIGTGHSPFCAVASLAYSMFMHGLAVGREMEKQDFYVAEKAPLDP